MTSFEERVYNYKRKPKKKRGHLPRLVRILKTIHRNNPALDGNIK